MGLDYKIGRSGWKTRFTLTTLFAVAALAQTSTNINLNLVIGDVSTTWSNELLLAQTGSVGSLGNAALVMTGSFAPITDSGITGPLQMTFELAFNEVDTIAISFNSSNPNLLFNLPATVSGGIITGGTGAYAGATGSIDLTISGGTTSGSGTMTTQKGTIPLTLTNFHGQCCAAPNRERDYFSAPVTLGGSLGDAPGTMVGYYYFMPAPGMGFGTITINFSSTDSLILWFGYPLTSGAGASVAPTFNGIISGGTGKYANAMGTLNYTLAGKGCTAPGTGCWGVTGTLTTVPGAVITQIRTIYGWPQIAFNTWLEIHGHNLVPADTPSTGVDWSDAPEFANGQMPTHLGPVSVSFGPGPALGGLGPGYIYFYCSAKTNPNCADDQINVLAPLLPTNYPSPWRVIVNNNGVPIADISAFRSAPSPALFSFDAPGHIAARHQDASLVGPASLFPGLSSPAKAGEIISLYGTGFGVPAGGGIVAGSATQSGSLPFPASCSVSGINAQAVGALVSPGLYQFNLTIPQGLPVGDNPVLCVYGGYPTFPGALIAVQ
jgi:uncharacterized protein (TIGR03437 family)